MIEKKFLVKININNNYTNILEIVIDVIIC